MDAVINRVAIRKIRALMRIRHISQRQLAEQLDWTQPYISRRLTGHVPLSLDDVDAIAAALDSSILELCDPNR